IGRSPVMPLGAVDRGEKAAGVEDDQSPKPVNPSSTCSASVGSELRNRGSVGRGGVSDSTKRVNAALISSASDVRRSSASLARRRFNSSGRYTVVLSTAHVW